MDDATLTTFLKHPQNFCKKLSKTNKQTRGVSLRLWPGHLHLKAKEEVWKFKYFTMPNYIIFKNML
jgi:hypothetical protein